MAALTKHNEEINEIIEVRRDVYDSYSQPERSDEFKKWLDIFTVMLRNN